MRSQQQKTCKVVYLRKGVFKDQGLNKYLHFENKDYKTVVEMNAQKCHKIAHDVVTCFIIHQLNITMYNM